MISLPVLQTLRKILYKLADDLRALIDEDYIDVSPSLTYAHPSMIEASNKLREDYKHLTLFEFNPTEAEFLNISFRYANQGDLLSIADVLRKVNYSEIVLVTGQPGAGKTTLMRYFAKMWAEERALSRCEMMFLTSLQDGQVKSLESLLSKAMNSFKLVDTDSISKEIQDKQGEGTCFLLDSYQWNYNNDYVDNLLRGRTLTKSLRIVTARPHKLAETLIEGISDNNYFEIIGFKKTDLPLYLNITSNNQTLKHAVLALWNDQPHIKELCTSPLLFSMVLSIVKSGNNESPLETRTQIYIVFVLKTIFQYSIKRPYYFVKHCVPRYNPPVNMCAAFKVLINASFELVFKGQQYYAERLSDEVLQTLNNQGFVSTETDNYTKFTFTHSTFAEFLAALQLATSPLETQLFYATLYNQSWYSVFQFYFGIHGTFLESNTTLISPILEKTSLFYSSEPWYYSELCSYQFNVEFFDFFRENAANKDKKVHFLLKEVKLFVNKSLCIYSDSFNQQFIKSFSVKVVHNLQFTESTYGNSITIDGLDKIGSLTKLWYCLEYDFKENDNCTVFPGVTSFHFNVRNSDDDIKLNRILQSFPTLKSLHLELYFVRNDHDLVTNLLENKHLRCINLVIHGLPLRYMDLASIIKEHQVIPYASGLTLVGRSIVIKPDHEFLGMMFSAISYLWMHWPFNPLQYSFTSKTSIKDYNSCTIIPLKSILKDPDRLQWLKVDGASQFQECKDYIDFTVLLKGLRKLRHLHISQVNIERGKVAMFLKESALNLSLATLEISHYQGKNNEMVHILENLPPSLHELILVDVGLSDHSVGVLSKVLRNIKNLHSLKLKKTSMTSKGLRILVTELESLVQLQSLDLSDNPTILENRSNLEALARLTNLQRLNIRGCKVKSEYKPWFLKTLSNWTKLESLSLCSHNRYGFWNRDYKAEFAKEARNLIKLRYYTGWNCVV